MAAAHQEEALSLQKSDRGNPEMDTDQDQGGDGALEVQDRAREHDDAAELLGCVAYCEAVLARSVLRLARTDHLPEGRADIADAQGFQAAEAQPA